MNLWDVRLSKIWLYATWLLMGVIIRDLELSSHNKVWDNNIDPLFLIQTQNVKFQHNFSWKCAVPKYNYIHLSIIVEDDFIWYHGYQYINPIQIITLA